VHEMFYRMKTIIVCIDSVHTKYDALLLTFEPITILQPCFLAQSASPTGRRKDRSLGRRAQYALRWRCDVIRKEAKN